MLDLPRKQLKAIRELANYLLFNIEINDRIEAVATLAQRFELSVGLLQKSLVFLEDNGAIKIQRKGHLGSYLSFSDHGKLSSYLNFNNLVCVMPMPYTKRYEGLATGIKKSIRGPVNFHYAFMRGASVRLAMLNKGHYDYCIVSKCAAESALKKFNNLMITAEFATHSYLGQHVLLKTQEKIVKLGVDYNSSDHLILSEEFSSKNPDIELVSINYNEVKTLLKTGEIDAAIINNDEEKMVDFGEIIELGQSSTTKKISQAVLVCRNERAIHHDFITKFMDKNKISEIQNQVLNKQMHPHY